MILESLCNIFFGILEMFLRLLPTLEFSVNLSSLEELLITFSNIFIGIGYLLPVKALLPVITLSLLMDSSHIIWAIIIRIKSFIPTMGS